MHRKAFAVRAKYFLDYMDYCGKTNILLFYFLFLTQICILIPYKIGQLEAAAHINVRTSYTLFFVIEKEILLNDFTDLLL